MTFREVGIGPLDLHKAFTADWLITASSVVKIRRVVKEANGTFASFLVNENLERLSIDEGVVRQVDFTRGQVGAGAVARPKAESSGQGLATRLEGSGQAFAGCTSRGGGRQS